MTDILSKIKPARFIVPTVLVVGAILAAVNSSGDRPATISEASAPSNTAQTVIAKLEALQEQNEQLESQLEQMRPDAVQAVSKQRLLGSVDGRVEAFDDETYAQWSNGVKDFAGHISGGLESRSNMTGERFELLLSNKLNGLIDRVFALAKSHNGVINWDDQEAVDTFAGQLLEQKAIAHIINRRIQGELPEVADVDISKSHMIIEGLSKSLFELQAQGTALSDFDLTPSVAVEEDAPPNGELTSNE